MATGTIADAAGSCRSAFNSLLDCFEERDWADLIERAQLLEAVEDEQARLNVWVTHIGIFAGYHSSLDYRLRETQRVRSLVLAQLEVLHLAQLHLLRTLQPVALPKALAENDATEYQERHQKQDQASLRGSEPIDDSDSSDGSDSAVSDERTAEVALESIHNAIDRLHRLAKVIRQPGLMSHISKANNFKPRDEYGNDEVEVFELFSLKVISTQTNSTPNFLIHRLSRSNASRRRLFLYRRKHQEFLSGKPQEPARRRPSTIKVENDGSESEQQPAVLPLRSTPAVSQVTAESRVQSSVAKATSFVESAFREDRSSKAAGSFAGTSIASSVAEARLPPPPKVRESGNNFECPYCCQLVSVQTLRRKYWRQHLIKDLEPYICLFEDCPQADTRYRDQSSWMTHLRSHAMRWACRVPSHSHGKNTQYFDSVEKYAHHLNSESSTGQFLQQAQIQQLVRLQHPIHDPAPLKACPFCPTVLDDFRQSQVVENYSREFAVSLSTPGIALRMQKHVASHLIGIASYSLPWLNDVEGDVASDRAPTLSTVSELSYYESVSRYTNNAFAPSDEMEAPEFEDTDIISEKADDSEWLFVRGVPDHDQEFDEMLAPFVRKYHIEMAFAEAAPLEPKLPCVHLPMARDPKFFSRESELGFLQDKLGASLSKTDTEGREGLQTCAMYGLSGIGKTQVAIEWTYRNIPQFDAIFWVHADEASKMSEEVNRIALKLGLVDEKSADSRDQVLTRELLRRWLGDPAKSFKAPFNTTKAKWLLVLDHVIDPGILEAFWPSTQNHGSILIISRRPMPWNSFRLPSTTLEPFDAREGSALMCNFLPHASTEEERQCASLISSQVRGRPYLLVHLTKWILGQGISFASFISQDHTRQDIELQKQLEGELVKFVVDEDISVLEMTFESIKEFRPLLDVLSMLDPDRIPKELLIPDDCRHIIQGYPETKLALDAGLDELVKYGLLIESQTNSTIYIMLRIVQEAVRKQMSHLYTRDVFDTCILLLEAHWPFRSFTWRHGTSRWLQCEELFPHVMHLRRIAPSLESDRNGLYPWFQHAKLWCDCGWYCLERGRKLEADIFSELAQNIGFKLKEYITAEAVRRDSEASIERAIDQTLAKIMHNRGCIAIELNKPVKSLQYLLKFNEVMMQELGNRNGGTDMRLALSFNELGCAYMLNEDYLHAEECFESSIDGIKNLDNYEPWLLSFPGVNLGAVYLLTGRLTEADDILLKALRDRERKFGFNDRESFITGRFFYTLGNVHDAMHDFDTSFEFHQRALNHYKNTLGSGHHRTADTLVRIARHFMRMSQIEEALDLIGRAIQIYEFDVAFQAELARARFWKSKILRHGGRAGEADQEYAASVELYQKIDVESNVERSLDEIDFDRKVTFWST